MNYADYNACMSHLNLKGLKTLPNTTSLITVAQSDVIGFLSFSGINIFGLSLSSTLIQFEVIIIFKWLNLEIF